MSFKLLELIFQIGKFLAITPSTIKVKNVTTVEKWHAIFMLAFYTVAVLISCIYRASSYRAFIHIRLTIHVMLDTTLYMFSICTILTAFRRRQWYRLMKNLRNVRSFRNNSEQSHYRSFVVLNLIYWVVISYLGWIFYGTMGMEFFKQYGIEYLQIYTQFLISFLMYAILKMLKKRYHSVKNSLLMKKFEVSLIKYDIRVLKECVDIFNRIFGWPFLMNIVYASLQILIYLSNIFLISSKFKLTLVISNINVILLYCVSYC
ncbi:hypothetical protein BDFB_009047 [Asbolus verrucosus]|uniref:Gustatory receptor n=1 Tax=Asbolus verrucosus TaxID=1661398 RepID=A0A482VP45_ASBVE|nr:hypothetical protein BDFB_009047 [Asbolus verrucosus]